MASNTQEPKSPFNVDLTKMFSDMKLPHMPDMESVLAAQRRNIEALTAANRTALEGMQAVARRNLEIMQQTMAELTENMRAMMGPEAPAEKISKQQELAKIAYERGMAHMTELSSMIQKVSSETVEVLTKRFNEAMEEVKSIAASARSEK